MAKARKAGLAKAKAVLVERRGFLGIQDAWWLSNGLVTLCATEQVGPRILHFGLAGGPNELKVEEAQCRPPFKGGWRLYGGHRLWNAPERKGLTALPDNSPVAAVVSGQTLTLAQPPEAKTGIQKEIEISLLPGEPAARVVHRLRNKSAEPQVLAPWALTVLPAGGQVLLPQPARGQHPRDLNPSSSLVLWPYSDLGDRRLALSTRSLRLRPDPKKRYAQKIGLHTDAGWGAWSRGGRLLVKRTAFFGWGKYPDMGCTHQAFTWGGMIEIETLAPQVIVMPGAATEHVECWWLWGKTPALKPGDAALAQAEPWIRRSRLF